MGRARTIWTLDGYDYEFRSAFEVDIAEQLIDYKVEWSYETVSIPYDMPATGHCLDCSSSNIVTTHNYITDFFVRLDDDSFFYIEAKGYFKARDRKKYLEIRKSNTDIDLRFVFQNDGWITKKRKTSYTRWCTQKKFESSILDVPEDWIYGR